METKELKNKLKEICGDDDERYNNEIEIFDFVEENFTNSSLEERLRAKLDKMFEPAEDEDTSVEEVKEN